MSTENVYKKFRTVKGDDVRIALTSGHTVIVGKDWIALHDRFWSEAYSKGCMSEDMLNSTPSMPQIIPPTKEEPQPLAADDRQTLIEKAMKQIIEKGNPDDFTQLGKVRSGSLVEILGFEPNKEERETMQEKLGGLYVTNSSSKSV